VAPPNKSGSGRSHWTGLSATAATGVASLEEAKTQLRAAWERWKAWAELEEMAGYSAP
jgi:hypothetical protein